MYPRYVTYVYLCNMGAFELPKACAYIFHTCMRSRSELWTRPKCCMTRVCEFSACSCAYYMYVRVYSWCAGAIQYTLLWDRNLDIWFHSQLSLRLVLSHPEESKILTAITNVSNTDTVCGEIFAGILFCEIVKNLAPRTIRGFNFWEYVACLVLRPIFTAFYFRECRLTNWRNTQKLIHCENVIVYGKHQSRVHAPVQCHLLPTAPRWWNPIRPLFERSYSVRSLQYMWATL